MCGRTSATSQNPGWVGVQHDHDLGAAARRRAQPQVPACRPCRRRRPVRVAVTHDKDRCGPRCQHRPCGTAARRPRGPIRTTTATTVVIAAALVLTACGPAAGDAVAFTVTSAALNGRQALARRAATGGVDVDWWALVLTDPSRHTLGVLAVGLSADHTQGWWLPAAASLLAGAPWDPGFPAGGAPCPTPPCTCPPWATGSRSPPTATPSTGCPTASRPTGTS